MKLYVTLRPRTRYFPPSTSAIASEYALCSSFSMRSDRRVLVVVGKDRDGLLQDDGAVVERFVHEMDGAAGDLHAVVNRLLLRLEAGKAGNREGWMLRILCGKARMNSGESSACIRQGR